jgi:hypothetical protein
MRPKSFSRAEASFLVAVPLAWAVLLLFHPVGDGDYYAVVRDDVTAWLTVHLGSMLLIPLLAGVLFVLLRGIDGTAARVSRVALVVFAVFYAGYEVAVGIGSGIIADAINALPVGERGAGAALLESYNESTILAVVSAIGSIAWVVAVTGAGIALYRRAHTASSVAVVFLLLISAPGIAIHVTPFGPVGLALFIVALVLVMRTTAAPAEEARQTEIAEAMVGQPGAA